ncbi:MAG: YdhR family protein [Caldilineaceae bacterium]|nr:YdhR family protein [Caldilineaceae bacterium]
MKNSQWKLCAVLFVFTMLFALLAPVLHAAPTLQTATPTPAPEEERESDTASADAVADSDVADSEEPAEDLQLVTAKVAADLVQPGRVLMSARGNHWIYDSVPPINGPNEEVNPLDGMLTALIACGMYIYEAVGIEQEIATHNLSATVQGELDPRGVAGANVNPRVRAFHVTMKVDGPSVEEAALMAAAFSTRCPIYTTLGLSAPISVTNVVDGEAQEPIATTADPLVDNDREGEAPELAKPAGSGRMIEFGRSVMSARGNHWIFDSVPPINGPNEEVNPLDALVGALPACGIMIYEAVAREESIALNAINATVEADLDPRGVAGAPVNPRIRAFRVTMNVSGPTEEEAAMMAEAFRQRCPIYTTYERAAPIEVTNVLLDQVATGVILEVDFTYNVETDEFRALAAGMAEAFLAVEGLVWKSWIIDEAESRGGGVYLFTNAAARQAYLEGELFATVQSHPALSDFRVQAYAMMAAESMITHAPVGAAITNDAAGIGTLLQVNFTYNVPTADYIAEVSPLAEAFAAAEGLRWKIWALDEENSQFSGILFFDTPEDVQTFAESELAATILNHPALSDFSVTPYSILAEESLTTHAPVGTVTE